VFERFTDRARRVLVLAQDEARIQHDNFIGSEHLLLGLLREEDGAAAKALQQLGISTQAVRKKVAEKTHSTEAKLPGSPAFTARLKKILELSLRESRQLGHEYIGTEHLLLGLLREGQGVAMQVLQSLGTNSELVREQVISLLRVDRSESRDTTREVRASASELTGFPTRVLTGPDQDLASGGMRFRVVGVLIFEECVQVHWRMSGIPEPLADWIRSPSEFFSPTGKNERSLGFVGLQDDLGSAYALSSATMDEQPDGTWAGGVIFTPAVATAASRLGVVWNGEVIEIPMQGVS